MTEEETHRSLPEVVRKSMSFLYTAARQYEEGAIEVDPNEGFGWSGDAARYGAWIENILQDVKARRDDPRYVAEDLVQAVALYWAAGATEEEVEALYEYPLRSAAGESEGEDQSRDPEVALLKSTRATIARERDEALAELHEVRNALGDSAYKVSDRVLVLKDQLREERAFHKAVRALFADAGQAYRGDDWLIDQIRRLLDHVGNTDTGDLPSGEEVAQVEQQVNELADVANARARLQHRIAQVEQRAAEGVRAFGQSLPHEKQARPAKSDRDGNGRDLPGKE